MDRPKGGAPKVTITETRTYVNDPSEYEGLAPISGEEAARKLEGGFDAYATLIESPGYKAKAEFSDRVMAVPDLGVMQLSLSQAGDLVAADMWLSGETDIEGPDADSIRRDDPALLDLLSGWRARIVEQMSRSIDQGSLKSSLLRRELLTGEINPENTFVAYEQLYDWLAERDYTPGDWMNEYVDEEATVHGALVDELYAIRARYQPIGSDEDARLRAQWRHTASEIELGIYPDADEASVAALRELVKAYSTEVARLNRELGNRQTGQDVRALTPKGRKTLHRLIASLCVAAGVKPAERGAANTVEAITQRAGLPVGDDTIRKVLAELPEVAEGR